MKNLILAVGSVALLSTSLVLADADGHGVAGAPWPMPAPTPTLSAEFGFDIVPAPVVLLADQDNEAYVAQDELEGAGSGPKPLRFAIPVPVALTLADGQWLEVEGGRLWRAEIRSENAYTARLHLTGINLPEGQQLRLSNPSQAESVVGPIEGVGEFGDGSAWGLALPTGRTMIEWFVPVGTKARALPFASVDYYHGYRNIFSEVSVGNEGGVAGNCHNQPACYATWSPESNGTIRLIFGGFLCSGQLTATTAADETPYVSTANHCISTQAEANSCQFNFFYRANTCGGGTSAGSNVTGSDLSSTYLASDCTLLMVRPTLPANVAWVGWTSATTALNTASTCLHHPGGAPQAISFGVKNANSFNCGSPTGNWASVSWNNGITEGGSSGSAIYRDADKKMYGVLTCGGSACTNTAADDGYGRWDIAVNTAASGFANLLAAGSDDAQEPNDTCATAKALTPGTYTALVVKRLDEDWYSMSVPPGASLTANLTYTHANGDVDVQVFTACGGTVALDRNGNVNNESFTFTNPGPGSTVYLRVYLGGDVRNEYSMTVSASVSAPANDECSGATAIGNGTVAFNTTNATNSAVAIPASCDEGAGVASNKDVWYRYTAPCGGMVTASTCGLAAFDTRITVYSGSACPTAASIVKACNDNGAGCVASTSSVRWPAAAGSTWYIRVGSTGATSGGGSLTTSCSACTADFTADGIVDGGDLGVLLGGWGGAVTTDLDGDGTTNGSDLGILLGNWGACP